MNSNRQPMQMEDIQRVSLEILKYVTEICERNNFRYCLAYGTLIGAIRHKGYIPWDDDVDILMPRPDYERFLEWTSAHKDEMGVYEIFNRQTNKDYIYAITRVSDSRYEIYKTDETNCGMGIFIDVYPYDGLGNDKEQALEKLKQTRCFCDIIVDMTRKDQSIPKQLNWKGRLALRFRRLRNKLRGIDYFHNKLNDLRAGNEFDKSEFVGPLMWYFAKPHKVLFERSIFDKLIKVPFEDGEFYVPAEYDKMLTQEYGDYMTPPPVENQVYRHHYKAYKK